MNGETTMRKAAVLFLLIFFILCMFCSAFAEKYTYTDMIDELLSTSYDKQLVFKKYYEGESTAVSQSAIITLGVEDNRAECMIHSSYGKCTIFRITSADILAKKFDSIFNLFLDYVDFNKGSYLRVRFVNNSDYNDPKKIKYISKIAYSPYEGEKDSEYIFYNDWSEFKKAYAEINNKYFSKMEVDKTIKREKILREDMEKLIKELMSIILKDPSSLQLNEWYYEEYDTFYYVVVDYSARNGFGGTNRDKLHIKLDYNIDYKSSKEISFDVIELKTYKAFYYNGTWLIRH